MVFYRQSHLQKWVRFVCTKDKSLIGPKLQIVVPDKTKKNQPNTIQKCHGYPTEMTFVFDFLTCKLTFQWLLIDYRYGFYVLLPSWTRFFIKSWELLMKIVGNVLFFHFSGHTIADKKIKTSGEGIVTKNLRSINFTINTFEIEFKSI